MVWMITRLSAGESGIYASVRDGGTAGGGFSGLEPPDGGGAGQDPAGAAARPGLASP